MTELKNTNELFNTVFKIYVDLNTDVYFDRFFHSIYSQYDRQLTKAMEKTKVNPFFLSQMGVLYNLHPAQYKGIIDNNFMDFLSKKFRTNTVFLLDNDGSLVHILIAQTDMTDRVIINNYFAHHIDELNRYQYFTTEYNPVFEGYKPLTAKPGKDKNSQDILLTFH